MLALHGQKAPLLDRVFDLLMNAFNKSTIFFGIPKLPARYGSLVMPLLLSILMTCIVSLISTFNGIGLSPEFAFKWLRAWVCRGWLHFRCCCLRCLWFARPRRRWCIPPKNFKHFLLLALSQ